MRVGIAGQEANQNASVKPPCINRCATRRRVDEFRHVFVGRFVFVIAGTPTEKLIELLKMDLGVALRPAVETADEQGASFDAFDAADLRIDDVVIGQECFVGDRGEKFVLNDVAQRAGQLSNEGRSLVTACRTKAFAFLNRK